MVSKQILCRSYHCFFYLLQQRWKREKNAIKKNFFCWMIWFYIGILVGLIYITCDVFAKQLKISFIIILNYIFDYEIEKRIVLPRISLKQYISQNNLWRLQWLLKPPLFHIYLKLIISNCVCLSVKRPIFIIYLNRYCSYIISNT